MIRCRCGASNTAGRSLCSTCGSPLALSEAAAPPEVPPDAGTLQVPEYLDDDASEARTLVTRLPGATGPCAACGQQLDAAWRFCKGCGTPTTPGAPVRSRHAVARMSPEGELLPARALREGRTVIGRAEGDLTFPQDATLSARHAAILVAGASCEVLDLGSTNGTFASIRGDEKLEPGDVILIGESRLLFRRGVRGHEVVEILDGGEEGRHVRLSGPRVVLGKDRGTDFSFPDDDHVSRRHAEVVRAASGHLLRDLGSTNRTFRIVTSRRILLDGDRIVTGGQIFEYRRLG